MTEEEGGEANKDKDPEKDLIKRALADFDTAYSYWEDDYKQGEEDNDFLQGDPWPAAIRSAREAMGRPCLNIPRLQPFVHQVENEQRQSRPEIKISPVDDQGDAETAKTIKGLIRNIEARCSADTVYDTAGSNAVRMGIGHIRLNTKYVSERSFDQEIDILEVFNPHSCLLDPAAKKQDGSDSNYGFVFEEMSREAFKAQWPDKNPVSFETYGETKWCTEKEIRIAEYFYKEAKDTTLYRLPSGMTLTAEEAAQQDIDVSGVPEEDQRPTKIEVIKWAKITAAEILEETTWPGKYIPIVPVYGDRIWYKGKRRTRSLIYHAKDSQRFLNYMRSASAEVIALQPKAPFIGIKGSFKSFVNKWRRANVDNEAVLEYDPVFVTDPVSGTTTLAPPPQRQTPPQGSMALMSEGQVASDDIKAALGMFAPSLGEQGDEKSGKAILARQQQGNNATFHFMDNRAVAQRMVGTILIDLIPHIYNRPQTIRILGDDLTPKTVRINEKFTDDKGREVLYDLTTGKYDVTVSVGPGYATKRLETVNTLVELVQANPAIGPLAIDIIVRNLDIAEADELAKRIKATMPPELQGDDPTAEKLKAMAAQNQALTQQIEQLVQQLSDKSAAEQLDREVKMGELSLKGEELKQRQTERLMPPPAAAPAAPAPQGPAAPPVEDLIRPIVQTIQEIEIALQDVGQAVSMLLDEEGGEKNEIPPEGDEGTPDPEESGA